ncbi:MAG: alpha/beta hydrolase [Burkholderiales bacterium]
MNTLPTFDGVEIETGSQPETSIIWLHGLGADGYDFVPIVQELDLTGLAPVRFVFPHAPSIPVTLNGGYVMRAWYDIMGTDLTRREDEAGLRQSQHLLNGLMEREHARGSAYERIVLAGFSQGCAMTLMTGLRFPQRLAGLIGLSGYLPLLDTTETERHLANADTPVFLAHGRQDTVVPYARGRDACNELERLGYSVEWQEYDMTHSLCAEEVNDISRFLLGLFKR